MIPASFDYHSPQSLEEALSLLQSHRDDVKVLSGGQSLLPLLKLRLGAAGHLVDLGRIPGLEYIRDEGGVLKIGGRTRESALEESDLIHAKYPLLAETAAVIADPLERKVGDFATAAAAAQVTLGAGGEVQTVGIALTNAGPVPLRAAEAERYLTGKQPTEEAIAEAARLAAAAASPSADRRGAVEYKREMARVLTGRAIRRAVERAKEH